jgi:hypothetical protein
LCAIAADTGGKQLKIRATRGVSVARVFNP